MSDAIVVSLIGGIVTVIGTIASVVIVFLRMRYARKNPEAVVPEDDEVREAEENYSADPRLFVKDIMEDRKQYREEVQSLRTEVGGLRQELKDFRETDRKFRNALARWHLVILAVFERHRIPMPYPIEQDREILADVIPAALEASQTPEPPE